MLQAYASKLCAFFDAKPGVYTVEQLNEMVVSVPFGEYHVIQKGLDEKSLPRLGETISVQEHMQASFFRVIGGDAWAADITKPFLIRRDFLEALEHWREWRVLYMYMMQNNLSPGIAFRNKPIPLEYEYGKKADYYIGDVRMFIFGDQAIEVV